MSVFVGAGELSSIHDSEFSEEDLARGAREFEMFWLRPIRYSGNVATVRVMLTSRLGGWRLKDGLVESLGLTVGDCVSAEVAVLGGPGIIDDDGETDLFADGEAAAWLVDRVLESGSPRGCVLDCVVRFSYDLVPVGANNTQVFKASLVLERGVRLVDANEDGFGLDGGLTLMRGLLS